MRIFLTGGTGFIGSHFLAAALKSGSRVHALRRSVNSTTTIPLPNQPNWIVTSLEKLQPKDLENCDVLVHLASAGVSPRFAPWNELVLANVAGTSHIVSVAKEAGIRRFVIAGTSHEYGASAYTYNPIPTTAPLEPLNLYGASKAAAYQLSATFARVYNLELYYGRLFSVYGQGQYEKNFWPSLRAAALSGADFPLSSGKQIRDFIPVEDAAQMLLNACSRPNIQRGEPFVEHIATGRPQSLLNFAMSEWRRLGATGSLLPGKLMDRIDEAPIVVGAVNHEIH